MTNKSKKGMTLLEVIILIAIICIIAVPISRVAVISLKSTGLYTDYTEALNYVEGSMEEIIAFGSGGGYDIIDNEYIFQFPVPNEFSRTITVIEDSLDGVVYKNVRISIGCSSINTVILETLITKKS